MAESNIKVHGELSVVNRVDFSNTDVTIRIIFYLHDMFIPS